MYTKGPRFGDLKKICDDGNKIISKVDVSNAL